MTYLLWLVEDPHTFCRWIIGGMGAFILAAGVGAYKWIVSLQNKNDMIQEAQIAYLKEGLKAVDKKGGN